MFESVVGSANVGESRAPTFDGWKRVPLVSPGSEQELSECLKVCAREKAAIVPAGAMTWLDCGNPLSKADVLVSLCRLDRILDYSPPDLTLIVEAGVRLSDLNATARKERQWLPLDPPRFGEATVGAIAACNSSGAMRMGFGAPRDYVIGLRLAHSDGTTSKSGGRVAKNVAGYDMNKLYVGSFGTLAILSQVTFKLRPIPESDATLLIQIDRSRLYDTARALLRSSDLQPASLMIACGIEGLGSEHLAVRFVESESAVRNQVQVAKAACSGTAVRECDEHEANRLWTAVADLDSSAAVAFRLSVPIARVFDTLLMCKGVLPDATMSADLGTGVIRAACERELVAAAPVARRLRQEAAAIGGGVIIEQGPPSLKREVDAWGEAGTALPLMRAIKKKLDPESLLNPGRFVDAL